MSWVKHGVAVRSRCIRGQTTKEVNSNLWSGSTKALSEMVKASEYSELRNRVVENIGRARGHEGEREAEGEAKPALASMTLSSWECSFGM